LSEIAEHAKIVQQSKKIVEHLNDLPYDRLVSFASIAEQYPIAEQFLNKSLNTIAEQYSNR